LAKKKKTKAKDLDFGYTDPSPPLSLPDPTENVPAPLSPNSQEAENKKLLVFAAVEKGDIETVKKSDKTHLSQIDPVTGRSLLMTAARNGRFSALSYLLENTSTLHLCDFEGKNAIMHAAEKGHRRIFIHLLIEGADYKIQNQKGLTAKDLATNFKHLPILDALNEWEQLQNSDNKKSTSSQSFLSKISNKLRPSTKPSLQFNLDKIQFIEPEENKEEQDILIPKENSFVHMRSNSSPDLLCSENEHQKQEKERTEKEKQEKRKNRENERRKR